MKYALVYGVFDLTHYGHYEKFKLLKDKGYKTIAGVVTDEFASSYKRKPFMTTSERMRNLRACEWVDLVVESNGDFVNDPFIFMVNLIAHGGDWSREDYMKHMGFTNEWLQENSIELIQLPYT